MIDTVPDELWTEVRGVVQETGIKTISMKKKCKKANWLSEEALQIAVKRRKVKSKGEKERYTHIASGGDGIPVELFQILKDDAVKVLHSICQQVWKTQQWPQDWKRSVFSPIPRKAMPKNAQSIVQLNSSHMLAK